MAYKNSDFFYQLKKPPPKIDELEEYFKGRRNDKAYELWLNEKNRQDAY